jgi:hypothetical protein
MELDLGTLLIGFFALLCCIVPFVIDYRSRKKKENNLLQALKKFAQQQNCQINQYDICQKFIIGIDKTKNNVFFYKQEKDITVEQSINLADIQTCKVITSHKTMTNARGSYKAVVKLELSFISNSKAEQKLEFFNADISPQFEGEIQLIEKWCKLVNVQLNSSLIAEKV